MGMSEYYEQVREEEIVEKILKVERWVHVNIGWHQDTQKGIEAKSLYSYDLPVELYKKYQWVCNWRKAKLQCQYPKIYLCITQYYYDKNSKQKLYGETVLKKLISGKAWVTRAKKQLKLYEDYMAGTLFFDKETDKDYIKALNKVEEKEEKVKVLEIEYQQAINENR